MLSRPGFKFIIMKGLIFIPDISGFTNFVMSINMDVGIEITKDLLNVIIDKNSLKLQISEIEGDAVLFYKIGEPISLNKVFNTFWRMNNAFDIKYQGWKQLYKLEVDLSLKLILHYGDIKAYYVKGYKKLYGEAIIEAHQLLKNGNDISEYILITNDYVEAMQKNIQNVLVDDFHYNLYTSQIYRGGKKIGYHFFSDIKKVCGIDEVITDEKLGYRNRDPWINTKRKKLIPSY